MLKMKNFNILGVHWKIQLWKGGGRTTNIEGRDCLKGGGAWQQRGGGVFWVGVDTPIHTMKLFIQSFPRYKVCLFSIGSNPQLVDIEYPQGICSPIFVVEELSLKIQGQHIWYKVFYPISCIDWILIFYSFLFGITIPQKSLFLHVFSWDLSLFYKELRQFKQKITLMFWITHSLCNNVNNFVTAR